MASKVLSSSEETTFKSQNKKARKSQLKSSASGIIKLKKPAPKHLKPGNWREGSVLDEAKKKSGDTSSTNISSFSPGPVVNRLDDVARETFPTRRPLEDPLDLVRCLICKKLTLKSLSGPHVAACNKIKKEKLQRKKEQKEARDRERKEAEEARQDDNDDDDAEAPKNVKKIAKKSAGKKLDLADDKKLKKRKADADPDKVPRTKKKKEEPKPKLPKPKGPVDVERQCGVVKDGVVCARSLTCKSHSMGAKRAVAGRSLPYDFLLAAYQKKNQAKQQKAAIDAAAPLEDDEPGLGPIDSDEELTSVMHGLSHWNPQPVVPPIIQIPIERKYMRERLREQLSQATNGFTVNIFKLNANRDDEADAEGDWEIDDTEVSIKQHITDEGLTGQRRPSNITE